jgi:hypothetical protein
LLSGEMENKNRMWEEEKLRFNSYSTHVEDLEYKFNHTFHFDTRGSWSFLLLSLTNLCITNS